MDDPVPPQVEIDSNPSMPLSAVTELRCYFCQSYAFAFRDTRQSFVYKIHTNQLQLVHARAVVQCDKKQCAFLALRERTKYMNDRGVQKSKLRASVINTERIVWTQPHTVTSWSMYSVTNQRNEGFVSSAILLSTNNVIHCASFVTTAGQRHTLRCREEVHEASATAFPERVSQLDSSRDIGDSCSRSSGGCRRLTLFAFRAISGRTGAQCTQQEREVGALMHSFSVGLRKFGSVTFA